MTAAKQDEAELRARIEYAVRNFTPDVYAQAKVVLPWGMTIWPRLPVRETLG